MKVLSPRIFEVIWKLSPLLIECAYLMCLSKMFPLCLPKKLPFILWFHVKELIIYDNVLMLVVFLFTFHGKKWAQITEKLCYLFYKFVKRLYATWNCRTSFGNKVVAVQKLAFERYGCALCALLPLIVSSLLISWISLSLKVWLKFWYSKNEVCD